MTDIPDTEPKLKFNAGDGIRKFFSDKYNLIFIGILIFAFAIRLYFFFLTKNQPFWWDEAEYAGLAKHYALGTPYWIAPMREFVVSALFSLSYILGMDELGARFIQVLISAATVGMLYFWAKGMYGKKIALVAALGMSVLWLHLFFSARILLYIWPAFFYATALYLFWIGYTEKNNLLFYLSAAITGFGLAFYYSTGFLAIIMLLALLAYEKLNFFKQKRNWIFAASGLLSAAPFMIYNILTKGSVLPRLSVVIKATAVESGAGLKGVVGYIVQFPTFFNWVFLSFLIIGLAFLSFEILLGYNLISKENKLKAHLLVLLAFSVPLAIYTWTGMAAGGGGAFSFYDAFIIPIFPAAFVIIGLGLVKFGEFIAKYNKLLAMILVVAILVFGAGLQLNQANKTISFKSTSYLELKQAGIWVKEHSEATDVVFDAAAPETTYYSERKVYGFPQNESELDAQIEQLQPKYIVLSVYERAPDWMYDYILKHNSTIAPVAAFGSPQPLAIVYELY